jgi:hypothetical protein
VLILEERKSRRMDIDYGRGTRLRKHAAEYYNLPTGDVEMYSQVLVNLLKTFTTS